LISIGVLLVLLVGITVDLVSLVFTVMEFIFSITKKKKGRCGQMKTDMVGKGVCGMTS